MKVFVLLLISAALIGSIVFMVSQIRKGLPDMINDIKKLINKEGSKVA